MKVSTPLLQKCLKANRFTMFFPFSHHAIYGLQSKCREIFTPYKCHHFTELYPYKPLVLNKELVTCPLCSCCVLYNTFTPNVGHTSSYTVAQFKFVLPNVLWFKIWNTGVLHLQACYFMFMSPVS